MSAWRRVGALMSAGRPMIVADRWRTATAAVLLVAAAAAPDLSAENASLSDVDDRERPTDWPEWRGSQRDGICRETGLLKKWGPDGPPFLWRVDGIGAGYSSVAIAGNDVYTMGQRDEGEFLIALGRSDGREAWAVRIGTEKPNSTPTIDGELVFALGYGGELVCVRRRDGREVWRRNLASEFGGKTQTALGFSESPLVDGDRVTCAPGVRAAAVVAFARTDGKTIWTTTLPGDVLPDEDNPGADGAGYSSAVMTVVDGVRQYVYLIGRGVIGVEATTGRLLWAYGRMANQHANVATPIVSGSYVFCSTAYQAGSALLELVKKPNASPIEFECREVYFLKPKVLQNHHGGLVRFGDHLYGGHGHNQGFPLCLELKTGRIAWRPGRGAGTGSAAVLYADGHLYFRYQNGVVALVEATPEAYRLKGQFRPRAHKGKAWAHPVIAGGRLYLRSDDALECYDVQAR